MNIRAIFVGIDRYADHTIRDLGGAARDARALHALFADTWPRLNSHVFIDEDATLENFKKSVEENLAECEDNEIIFVTFAGHGSFCQRLIFHNTSSSDLPRTALSADDFVRLFSNTKAQAVVLVLDCCFSGAAPARVAEAGFRSRSEGFSFEKVAGRGRYILAASLATQEALEDPQSRQGVFTQALIDVLQEGGDKKSLADIAQQTSRRAAASAARLGYVQTPAWFGFSEGDLVIPVFEAGPRFAALNPQQSKIQIGSDFQSLSAFGVPESIIHAWQNLYPAGLNELQQSAVNQYGVLSGKNTIVAAPTSAGKTFIGELAAIRAALDGKRSAFLLPYRALVNEKYEEFEALYGQVAGLRVRRASGDFQDDIGDILNAKYEIAFFTFETFLALSTSHPALLHQLGAIIVDEVHFLTDDGRGIAVELLLTNLLAVREQGVSPQLIALSAVIGGLKGFDSWLGATLLLDEERPVPLSVGVLDRSGSMKRLLPNGEIDETNLLPREKIIQRKSKPSSQDVIVPLVRELTSKGEKVLIFRNQRGSAVGAASYLADELGLPAAEAVLDALPNLDLSRRSEDLRRCLRGGTAFHTADLARVERLAVERAFRDPNGPIRVLTATTTVAAGVNLPASTVIIPDNTFRTADGPIPFRVAEMKNMAGRAGRLGLNEEGQAILLAEQHFEREQLFNRYIISEPEPMASTFEPSSTETWLVRLLLQVGSINREQALTLLSRTFGGYQAALEDGAWSDNMRLHVEEDLDEFSRLGLVVADGSNLRLSELGVACGRSALSLRGCLQIVEALQDSNPRTAFGLLAMLQATPEMDEVYTPLQKSRGESCWEDTAEDYLEQNLSQLMHRQADDEMVVRRRFKRITILARWLDGTPVAEIEAELTMNPFFPVSAGDITRIADTSRFYMTTVFDLAHIATPELAPSEELAQRFLGRLERGVPEHCADLMRIAPPLSRGQILALGERGFHSSKAVLEADDKILDDILDTSVVRVAKRPNWQSQVTTK